MRPLDGGPSQQNCATSTPAISALFGDTFAWQWGLGFAATQGQAYSRSLNTNLPIASGFGPSLVGIVVVAIFSTSAGFRKWLARCLNWRIGWQQFALVFLGHPLSWLLCAAHAAIGGPVPAWPSGDEYIMVVATFGPRLLVGGPMSEEFGWRGYAMNALTDRLKRRAASLIVGAAWGLQHLPLFFMVGTVQSHMPIAPFMISIVISSMLFGWLFAHTQRSVLPAIALHMSVNAWTAIFVGPVDDTVTPFAPLTTLIVATAVLLFVRAGSGPEPGGGPSQCSAAGQELQQGLTWINRAQYRSVTND